MKENERAVKVCADFYGSSDVQFVKNKIKNG